MENSKIFLHFFHFSFKCPCDNVIFTYYEHHILIALLCCTIYNFPNNLTRGCSTSFYVFQGKSLKIAKKSRTTFVFFFFL